LTGIEHSPMIVPYAVGVLFVAAALMGGALVSAQGGVISDVTSSEKPKTSSGLFTCATLHGGMKRVQPL
jgi:hypothetical protein